MTTVTIDEGILSRLAERPLAPHLRRAAVGAILGLAQADIARDLKVSKSTLKVYLCHTYARCRVTSRAELMTKYFALALGEMEAAVNVWAGLADAQQAKLDALQNPHA